MQSSSDIASIHEKKTKKNHHENSASKRESEGKKISFRPKKFNKNSLNTNDPYTSSKPKKNKSSLNSRKGLPKESSSEYLETCSNNNVYYYQNFNNNFIQPKAYGESINKKRDLSQLDAIRHEAHSRSNIKVSDNKTNINNNKLSNKNSINNVKRTKSYNKIDNINMYHNLQIYLENLERNIHEGIQRKNISNNKSNIKNESLTCSEYLDATDSNHATKDYVYEDSWSYEAN